MLLVTGGAGFIGANFVSEWLAAHDESIINLDKLTYAGHRQNLAALEGDTSHVFVRGDIGDSALVERLWAEHRPRAVVNFATAGHRTRHRSSEVRPSDGSLLAARRTRRCAACRAMRRRIQPALADAGDGSSGPKGSFIAPEFPTVDCGYRRLRGVGSLPFAFHPCTSFRLPKWPLPELNFAGPTIHGMGDGLLLHGAVDDDPFEFAGAYRFLGDGGVYRCLEQFLDAGFAYCFAKASDLGGVTGEPGFVVGLATEVLPDDVLRPAGNKVFVTEIEGVLEVEQGGHETNWQPGTTRASTGR